MANALLCVKHGAGIPAIANPFAHDLQADVRQIGLHGIRLRADFAEHLFGHVDRQDGAVMNGDGDCIAWSAVDFMNRIAHANSEHRVVCMFLHLGDHDVIKNAAELLDDVLQKLMVIGRNGGSSSNRRLMTCASTWPIRIGNVRVPPTSRR